VAGPVKATAIGNVIIQARAREHTKSCQQLRQIVRNSFPLRIYKPGDHFPDAAHRLFKKISIKL
jgi:rhamnulokinase